MHTRESIAPLIDHTLLKAEATADDIRRACDEAMRFGFATVIVNPYRVPLVRATLEGSTVRTGTVAGFPLGAVHADIKAAETARGVDDGAVEIDMVLNVGAMLDGERGVVENDVRAVVEAAGDHAAVKVILETCLLSNEQIREACLLCKHAGAAFVKTSTGLNGPGATIEVVRLMRETVGPDMGVKAAGGLRDFDTVRAMIDAGANRIGTSSGMAIVGGSL